MSVVSQPIKNSKEVEVSNVVEVSNLDFNVDNVDAIKLLAKGAQTFLEIAKKGVSFTATPAEELNLYTKLSELNVQLEEKVYFLALRHFRELARPVYDHESFTLSRATGEFHEQITPLVQTKRFGPVPLDVERTWPIRWAEGVKQWFKNAARYPKAEKKYDNAQVEEALEICDLVEQIHITREQQRINSLNNARLQRRNNALQRRAGGKPPPTKKAWKEVQPKPQDVSKIVEIQKEQSEEKTALVKATDTVKLRLSTKVVQVAVVDKYPEVRARRAFNRFMTDYAGNTNNNDNGINKWLAECRVRKIKWTGYYDGIKGGNSGLCGWAAYLMATRQIPAGKEFNPDVSIDAFIRLANMGRKEQQVDWFDSEEIMNVAIFSNPMRNLIVITVSPPPEATIIVLSFIPYPQHRVSLIMHSAVFGMGVFSDVKDKDLSLYFGFSRKDFASYSGTTVTKDVKQGHWLAAVEQLPGNRAVQMLKQLRDECEASSPAIVSPCSDFVPKGTTIATPLVNVPKTSPSFLPEVVSQKLDRSKDQTVDVGVKKQEEQPKMALEPKVEEKVINASINDAEIEIGKIMKYDANLHQLMMPSVDWKKIVLQARIAAKHRYVRRQAERREISRRTVFLKSDRYSTKKTTVRALPSKKESTSGWSAYVAAASQVSKEKAKAVEDNKLMFEALPYCDKEEVPTGKWSYRFFASAFATGSTSPPPTGSGSAVPIAPPTGPTGIGSVSSPFILGMHIMVTPTLNSAMYVWMEKRGKKAVKFGAHTIDREFTINQQSLDGILTLMEEVPSHYSLLIQDGYWQVWCNLRLTEIVYSIFPKLYQRVEGSDFALMIPQEVMNGISVKCNRPGLPTETMLNLVTRGLEDFGDASFIPNFTDVRASELRQLVFDRVHCETHFERLRSLALSRWVQARKNVFTAFNTRSFTNLIGIALSVHQIFTYNKHWTCILTSLLSFVGLIDIPWWMKAMLTTFCGFYVPTTEIQDTGLFVPLLQRGLSRMFAAFRAGRETIEPSQVNCGTMSVLSAVRNKLAEQLRSRSRMFSFLDDSYSTPIGEWRAVDLFNDAIVPAYQPEELIFRNRTLDKTLRFLEHWATEAQSCYTKVLSDISWKMLRTTVAISNWMAEKEKPVKALHDVCLVASTVHCVYPASTLKLKRLGRSITLSKMYVPNRDTALSTLDRKRLHRIGGRDASSPFSGVLMSDKVTHSHGNQNFNMRNYETTLGEFDHAMGHVKGPLRLPLIEPKGFTDSVSGNYNIAATAHLRMNKNFAGSTMLAEPEKLIHKQVNEILQPLIKDVKAEYQQTALNVQNLRILGDFETIGFTPDGKEVRVNALYHEWLEHLESAKRAIAIRETIKQAHSKKLEANIFKWRVQAKAFVKLEIAMRPISKSMRPRMIQFLDPEYMIHLAPHAYFSYEILKSHMKGKHGIINTAGMTPDAVSEIVNTFIGNSDIVSNKMLRNICMLFNGDDNLCLISKRMYESGVFYEMYTKWGRDPVIHQKRNIYQANFCSGGFVPWMNDDNVVRPRFMLRVFKQLAKMFRLIVVGNKELEKVVENNGNVMTKDVKNLMIARLLSAFMNFNGCPFMEPIIHACYSMLEGPSSLHQLAARAQAYVAYSLQNVKETLRDGIQYKIQNNTTIFKRSDESDDLMWANLEQLYGKTRRDFEALAEKIKTAFELCVKYGMCIELDDENFSDCLRMDLDAKVASLKKSLPNTFDSGIVYVIEADCGAYDATTTRDCHEQNVWFQKSCFGETDFVRAIGWRRRMTVTSSSLVCSVRWTTEYQMLSGFYDTSIGNGITNITEMISSLVLSYPSYS